MNKSFLFLIIVLTNMLFCNDLSEKIRVSSKDIYFSDQNMFAHLNGEWIPINAIYSDALGFYIRNDHTRWICECYYNNYGGDATCKRRDEITGKFCGKPRPW